MRHALEPDHLAAVSTVLAEQRSSRASVVYAGLWGLGHAAMLLLVGGGLYVVRGELPERVSGAFELIVAVMLVALGVRALYSLRRVRCASARVSSAHARAHLLGAAHAHGPSSETDRAAKTRFSVRPIGIGLVHGLAGSGALTALVVSKSLSLATGLAFMIVYGIGAACGMIALAGVLGYPLSRIARDPRGPRGLLAVSGSFALLFGVFWGLRSLHVV